MRASILRIGFAMLVTGNYIAQTETKSPQYSAPSVDISVAISSTQVGSCWPDNTPDNTADLVCLIRYLRH